MVEAGVVRPCTSSQEPKDPPIHKSTPHNVHGKMICSIEPQNMIQHTHDHGEQQRTGVVDDELSRSLDAAHNWDVVLEQHVR